MLSQVHVHNGFKNCLVLKTLCMSLLVLFFILFLKIRKLLLSTMLHFSWRLSGKNLIL